MSTRPPTRSEVGLYVTRELLESVEEDRRADYMRVVEEFASRKYQLGVEVARQLPRLLDVEDDQSVARYLDAVRTVAEVDWRAGVEAARYLHHLQASGDPELAEGYAAIVTDAVTASSEGGEEAAERELAELEAELAAVQARVASADGMRQELVRRRRRDERRFEQAVTLARTLPGAVDGVGTKRREALMRLVHDVARSDAEAALAASATLAELLATQRLSPEGAGEWVSRGLDVLERSLEVGRAYFKLSTKQAIEVVEELREGLRLRQVARVLKLYATALSGRDVAIRGTDELSSMDPMSADHIVLPPDMSAFEDDGGNFTAYKVATAHGAGRIEFGTYGFRLADIPETVSALRARYSGSGLS